MRMKGVTIGLVLLWAATAAAQESHAGHGGHNPDTSSMVGAADAAMSGALTANARKHLRLSPTRRATSADSARARDVVRSLRAALARYADTAAATADGYRMFLPNVKQQRVFHFTNYRHAIMEAVRFDPAKPTSLLYEPVPGGPPRLIGAMYSAPKRTRASRLDERIPLSIARWHQHVNWCLPPRGEAERWSERFENVPIFGPESPVASKAQCDDVGGRFMPTVLGWMLHANVFAGDDLATVFAHEH
jgi:hypothetical protein